MSEAKDKTIALNVRLKPMDHSNLSHQANYSYVGVAQGIAYVDFGFIEPALLGAIARTAKDGQAAPKASSSPVWPWAWTCSRGCISRFSKYWLGYGMRGSRKRRVKRKRSVEWKSGRLRDPTMVAWTAVLELGAFLQSIRRPQKLGET